MGSDLQGTLDGRQSGPAWRAAGGCPGGPAVIPAWRAAGGTPGEDGSVTPNADRPAAVATAVVDLNADVGESFGAYRIGSDDELLALVTSASVACGFHGGDPAVMRRTVAVAVEHSVVVGAHVGYPDLRGFGRRPLAVPPDELFADVLYQLGALDAIARAVGTTVRYVKPHGALYHAAAADPVVGRALLAAVRAFNPTLPVLTLPGAVLVDVAADVGVPVIVEGFPDRGYTAVGTLVPRGEPGAVIDDPEEAAARAVAMTIDRVVTAVDGTPISLAPRTLCIHGDTPNAPRLAAAIVARLRAAGVELRPFA